MPVAETCASPADEDCHGHDCVRWAALFGTGGDQTVGDVAVDVAGNVFIAGVFSRVLSLDASNTLTAVGDDVYLAKLDPTGKALWSKSFSAATSLAASTSGQGSRPPLEALTSCSPGLPRSCHALATPPPSCPRRRQICAALLARPC